MASEREQNGGGEHDHVLDPFAGPDDPAHALASLDPDDRAEHDHGPHEVDDDEREQLLEDLADLEVFEALLGARGVRGLSIDCGECDEVHLVDWSLTRANLRSMLAGSPAQVHEPAFDPDPTDYVSWDYARGYTDAVVELDDESRESDCGESERGGRDGPGGQPPVR